MLKFTYAKCLAWKNYTLMNLIESEALDWRKLGVRSAGKQFPDSKSPYCLTTILFKCLTKSLAKLSTWKNLFHSFYLQNGTNNISRRYVETHNYGGRSIKNELVYLHTK